MSKGPGRVQRGVIAALYTAERDRWWTMTELASAVVADPPTRAAIESVRRAAKTLAERGDIHLEEFDEYVPVRPARVAWGDYTVYRRGGDAARGHLFAHLPLSVEERAARGQLLADLLERLVALDRKIGPT